MDIKEFLNTSLTAYHTVKNSESILQENGFKKLTLDNFSIERGGKYYITENGSAVIAFKVGDLAHYAFNIVGSHTDSPALKVKGKKLMDSPEGKRLNIEMYGGLIRYSFMDIPLQIAGRLFVKADGGLTQKLVESSFNVNVPSLCIHHNPTVNDNCSLNAQVDMLPLVGGDKEDIYSLLSDNEVIDADLYVVPSVKAYESGVQNQFLCSPRIDNLTSVYTSLYGLIEANPSGVAIAACFDNEEIGSETKQGAGASFLTNVLKAINAGLGFGKAEFALALKNGFVLSSDNGHAVHPAHPEKSDVAEKVYLNKGIVIKHHTNYATDGLSSAVVKAICEKSGIAWQDYYNRSDVRCGGTIGKITSSQLTINTCDIGLAQLAMHSAIETVGAGDIALMQKLVKAFYDTKIIIENENINLL